MVNSVELALHSVRHVIHRVGNPRLLSSLASYDVAGGVYLALHIGGGGQPHGGRGGGGGGGGGGGRGGGGHPSDVPGANLYVSNVAWEAGWQDLKVRPPRYCEPRFFFFQ